MSKSQSFAKEVKDRYPQVVIKDVYSDIASLRQIKCKEEVEEIKKAAHITAKGVELLMKECKPGMKEYELEAYFDFYLKQNGVKDYAFKTIAIRPGVGFYEINDKANNLLAEACVRLGLIEDKKDYRKYYFHSIGHSLGLDTHDVGKRDIILEEGMVYTVEPGLYIEEEAIGIRIEDDVLVTKDGCEVLTKECIKSVEDIEKFMSNR